MRRRKGDVATSSPFQPRKRISSVARHHGTDARADRSYRSIVRLARRQMIPDVVFSSWHMADVAVLRAPWLQVFRALDTNSDGVIDRTEFVAAYGRPGGIVVSPPGSRNSSPPGSRSVIVPSGPSASAASPLPTAARATVVCQPTPRRSLEDSWHKRLAVRIVERKKTQI